MIVQFTKVAKALRAGVFALLVFGGCSKQEWVDEKDVEYRKNDTGSLILYKIGASQPFGTGKVGRVSGRYENGQKRFEVGFFNGIKHGTFFFWQPNGMKRLSGAYDMGKREGAFIAYGKAGELIYEKNFLQDELEGNFTLYYPMSHSEVFRYSEFVKKRNLQPEQVPVKNNLRMQTTFASGLPVGPYRLFYHPRGQKNMTLQDLLKEEGAFDDQGKLVGEQTFYYPRTESLVVYMPDDQPLDTFHLPSQEGLSRAIDQCYKALEDLPAYRNPEHLPAKVFAVDSRGNRIAPIWTSDLVNVAIRNLDGFLLPIRFPPTFETYRDEAVKTAEEILLELEITESEKVKTYEKMGASIDLVGLDAEGQIIDILWSSRKREDVIHLEDRILRKRTMIKRAWESGNSSKSEWLVPDGLRLVIENTDEPISFFR